MCYIYMKCTFFQIWTLWMNIGISLGTMFEPRVYEPTGCMSTDAVWYTMPSRLDECLVSCIRQSACSSVSYNRFSTLCVLRESNLEPVTNGNCYHINILDNDLTILEETDPCRLRLCNNQSICESDPRSGQFYNCRLLYCDSNNIPDIPNARIASSDRTKVGSTNAYLCNDGYTMFGDSRIECLADGNWSTPNLTCYKDCPSYIHKVGAIITHREGLRFCYNTNVTYFCIHGYYNLTDTTTTCLSNGTWSPFECLKYCTLSTVPLVNNGEATAETWNTIYHNATYSCNVDYYKSTTDDTISCYRDGQWETPVIECWKYCTSTTIPAIDNGQGTAMQLSTVHDTATYSCDTGYYLSVATNTITCSKTGVWATPSVECWKYCLQPTGPVHSAAEGYSTAQYTSGIEVTFTCTGEYYPSSEDRTTMCKSDGTWTSMGFSCNKYCGQPPVDVGKIIVGAISVQYSEVSSGGGKDKYTTSDSVTYRCLVAASICGDNKRHCGSDGYWHGTIKCCLGISIICCENGNNCKAGFC